MAFTKSFTFQGLTIQNGYIKVASQYGTKESLNFHVDFCKSPSESALYSQTFVCGLNLNGSNPIKQAYLFLKTLPEFSDAVDC